MSMHANAPVHTGGGRPGHGRGDEAHQHTSCKLRFHWIHKISANAAVSQVEADQAMAEEMQRLDQAEQPAPKRGRKQ